jgi:hypothetical protein
MGKSLGWNPATEKDNIGKNSEGINPGLDKRDVGKKRRYQGCLFRWIGLGLGSYAMRHALCLPAPPSVY